MVPGTQAVSVLQLFDDAGLWDDFSFAMFLLWPVAPGLLVGLRRSSVHLP